MKKTSASHKAKKPRLLYATLWGNIAGLISMIAMLALFSALCTLMPSPHALITPLCFFSIFTSAFLTGLFGVKRNGGRDALICGGICGVAYMLLLWLIFALIGVISGDSGQSTASFIWKLCVPPCSLAGGFFGLKNGNVKSRKRKF